MQKVYIKRLKINEQSLKDMLGNTKQSAPYVIGILEEEK